MQNNTALNISKAFSFNNVNKNAQATTKSCKSFSYHNIKIANNDLKRITPSAFNIFCIMKIYNKDEYNAFEIENLLPIKQSRPTTLKEIESICDLQLASKRYKENKIGKTTKVSLNNVEPLHNYTLINSTIAFDTNLNKQQKYWLAVMLIDDNDYINDPYYIKNFCNTKHKGKIKESTFREYLKVFNDNEYIKYNPSERNENSKFKKATITILPKARPFNNVEKTVENHVDNININLKEKPVREKFNVIEETKVSDNTNNIVLDSSESKTEIKNCFKELKKELGDNIYQNWIAECHFEVKGKELIISSKTKFKKEWVENKYKREIEIIFNKTYNINFNLEFKIDKDCIPNKELLVEEETSNIQPNVVCLDSKRKENNKIRKNFDEWLAILDTTNGHKIIDSIEASIFEKRPHILKSTTMLNFNFIENQIKLMKIRFPNQNKMTPDMFISAVSSFIAREYGNIAEMSKNNHCPRVVVNC